MTARVVHICIIFFCLVPSTALPDRLIKVRTVEFKGLRLLSKYDVIRGVRMKSTAQGIIIDMDSLTHALAGNYFIATYRIDERGATLVISIEEKKPEIIVAVEHEGISAIYELDSDHTIISKNDAHTANLPVLHIKVQDMRDNFRRDEVRRLFEVLDRVKRDRALIYRELSEIYFEGEQIRIFLRGRKTEFMLSPDENDFTILQFITGYCDRLNQYPDRITIADDAAIIQ
jgi:hypothetical protein